MHIAGLAESHRLYNKNRSRVTDGRARNCITLFVYFY